MAATDTANGAALRHEPCGENRSGPAIPRLQSRQATAIARSILSGRRARGSFANWWPTADVLIENFKSAVSRNTASIES